VTARKEPIVKHMGDELRAMQPRDEDKSDGTGAAAMTEAEIDAEIAADPDEAGMLVNGAQAFVELPQPKTALNMQVDSDVLNFFWRQGKATNAALLHRANASSRPALMGFLQMIGVLDLAATGGYRSAITRDPCCILGVAEEIEEHTGKATMNDDCRCESLLRNAAHLADLALSVSRATAMAGTARRKLNSPSSSTKASSRHDVHTTALTVTRRKPCRGLFCGIPF
jgi:uncharacterized protein (DUF4415 family)